MEDDQNTSRRRDRHRSRSFELTKRSDSRSNSALRRTPKPMTNESVEKEISSYFKKKYSDNMIHERNLQDKIEFIRRIYLNHNHNAQLSDQQKQQLRDLSGEKNQGRRSTSNLSRRTDPRVGTSSIGRGSTSVVGRGANHSG